MTEVLQLLAATAAIIVSIATYRLVRRNTGWRQLKAEQSRAEGRFS